MLRQSASTRCQRRGRTIGTALVAWMLTLVLAACGSPSDPEQALRDTMTGLEHALNQRDVDAIAAHLADDFAGPEGMGHDEAKRLATAMFLRYRNTRVQLASPQVTMQGSDRATVEVQAVLLGGSAALLPESGQVYAIRTGWRLDAGEWQLVHASWQPAL